MWGVTFTAVRVGNLPDKSIYWNKKSASRVFSPERFSNQSQFVNTCCLLISSNRD